MAIIMKKLSDSEPINCNLKEISINLMCCFVFDIQDFSTGPL